MATILSSFKEASQVLKERGLKIDAKKIQEITKRYARRIEIVKQHQDIEITETLAGCRVIISTAGLLEVSAHSTTAMKPTACSCLVAMP